MSASAQKRTLASVLFGANLRHTVLSTWTKQASTLPEFIRS